MFNVYNRNGLIFWTEEEIRLRRMMEEHFVFAIKSSLQRQNKSFEMIQIEATLLTPMSYINKNYSAEDFYVVGDGLALRPETTMGSYAYLQELLKTHSKVRLPACVWQHGKSFRREQDQPTKFMRLKEFYQLEFQIVYSPSTKNDYSIDVIASIKDAIAEMIGSVRIEDSDRLPSYSEWTRDIVHSSSSKTQPIQGFK
jgi:glycyl-tRNA synthetase